MAAAIMANRVLTPLNLPRVSPTFPFSARSMEMASFRGMKKCIPRELINRKTSMVPYPGDSHPMTTSPASTSTWATTDIQILPRKPRAATSTMHRMPGLSRGISTKPRWTSLI